MIDPSQDADSWDAAAYDDAYGFVWRQGAGPLELLAPRAGERVLDLGCGTGHLTAEIAAAGAEVVGIDSSRAMIGRARASYPALRFEVMDGRDFCFPEPFDAVFSNAALHWMRPPERVAERIAAALRPGGRLVAELGGRGNVAAIVEALSDALGRHGHAAPPSPWYFPSVGEYAALLESRGLAVRFAALFPRPTELAGGSAGLRRWLEMFAASWFDAVPAEGRESVVRAVEERLRPRLFRDGAWRADYVRLRVVAELCRVEPREEAEGQSE